MPVDILQIPEPVRDWIYSGDRADLEAQYLEFVDGDELDRVHDLVRAVYAHDLTPTEFVDKMHSAIPGPRGEQLAKDFLGFDFIRAQDWFPENIAGLLKSLGGDQLEYKSLLNGDEAIEDALRGVNVELIPPRTRESVFAKMQDYLNGQLEKASLLEAMMKSLKIGGWGWDQDTAIPVIEILEKHLHEAQDKHAAFASKAKFAEIDAKKKAAREVMSAESGVSSVSRPTTSTTSTISTVPTDLPPLPDPFAFIVQENIPHLADTELNLPPLPNPFEELLAELSLSPVPEPDYAYANIHEHRRLAETEPPKTPLERALHASDILLEKELLEIERKKEELMKDVPETAIVVSSTLDALLERIMDESGFTSTDTSLVRRVRNIVSSRLRDIRGSEETAKLLAKIGQGTRDLPRDLVEKLVMLTEQAFLEFQRKVIERGLQRERSRRVRERDEVLEKKREDIFAAEQELNARFKKLTGKDSQIVIPARAGIHLEENGSPTKSGMTARVTPERKVQVTLSQNSKFQIPNSPVTDIKYQRQLSGPIEELRNMRLTDFRRLSKDPKAATEKVMAKLDLLAAESVDKRVQGAVAWRESPIMKLYLAATKAALDEATPLTAILDKKRKEIPEMLTIEECQAIRELNTRLRY